MKIWTQSAIRNYYLDPEILFLKTESRDDGGQPVAQGGYYVAPHCGPDCRHDNAELSRVDLGPFPTANAAREWSAKNLASID